MAKDNYGEESPYLEIAPENINRERKKIKVIPSYIKVKKNFLFG